MDVAPLEAIPRSSTRIDAVLTGRAVPYTRPDTFSAIHKQPHAGKVSIGPLGLEGDEHGNPEIHGGPEKAVHYYPREHYAHWRQAFGDHPLLAAAGGFGENLSGHGITEADVCIADRYRVGTALLEVSQGRSPCWKLNDRFGIRDAVRQIQSSGRTGWYFRVIEPGEVAAGDEMRLLERPHPTWTLLRLNTLLFDRVLDLDELQEAAALPLTSSLRKLVENRLEHRQREDWNGRIDGPPRELPET